MLNMRSLPSAQGDIVCKLEKDSEVVGPDSIGTAWVSVHYHDNVGYVNAKYLSLVELEAPKVSSNATVRPWYYLLDWEGEGYRWLAYVILGMGLLMWAELKFLRRMDLSFLVPDDFGNNRGSINLYRWVNAGGVIIFATTTFVYIWLMGNNALWFIMDVSPWYWVVLNFIIFIYVFIDLLAFFIRSVLDITLSVWVNVKGVILYGLIAWVLGVFGSLVCILFHLSPHYVLIAEGLLQAAAVVIILVKMSHTGHFLLGLFAAFIYLAGSAAIVALLTPIALIFFLIVAAALALSLAIFFGKMPGGILSMKDGIPNPIGVRSADSTPDREVFYIINPEGKNTRLLQINDDLFDGSDGYSYQRLSGEFKRI